MTFRRRKREVEFFDAQIAAARRLLTEVLGDLDTRRRERDEGQRPLSVVGPAGVREQKRPGASGETNA